MSLKTRLQTILASQSMMRSIGAQTTVVEPGFVELQAPIGEGFRQHNGFGHAGLTFTLGDTAGGGAAITLVDEDHAVVTSEIGIHLLAPAKGELLIARGKVIKPGKRLIVIQSDVYARQDDKERHIATLSGTMVPFKL
jgi:uncharacterized protein (TIGR00369 family)